MRPIIDRAFPFDQAREAGDRMRGGSAPGKIILTAP
jgi:NADPH:quinone reductase-like Zn-dependent oxidoreductase